MKIKELVAKLPIPRIVRENPFSSLIYTGLVVAVGVLIFLFVLAQTLPSIEEINSRQVAQSTKIMDRTGEISLFEVSNGERRTIVPLAEMPKTLQNATIAIEDERFYQESAVSFRGIARAVFVNLIHGGVVQGGSTITQQLARNAFLTLEQTPTRKLKELLLAIRLNNNYSKDDILGLYLNEITYGPNIYGVETASQVYFKKSVTDINLAEAALLASIPKGPSYYSPWGSHTDKLFARQKLVLQKMNDLGYITDAEKTEAINTPITFQPQGYAIKAPHFVFAVQDYLIEKYGEDLVRAGGLVVKTTLDMKLQEIAEKVVKEGAERNTTLYKGTNAALVAADPKTGQILAMVGSKDYFDRANEGNYNVATQGLRQPGSALKPFVYLTAFKEGYTPDTVLFDVPTEFVPNNPNCPAVPDYKAANTVCFHPQDYGEYVGPTSIRNALAQSMNIPAVKALYLVGIKDAMSTISDFGVTTLTDANRYGLSLVLGGGEVHLVDLISAYSVLANDGIKHDQNMILEIRDAKGVILEKYEEKATKVADEQPVRQVNDILSDVQARAPLYSSSLGLTVFDGREVAMKTGTTNDYHDAWTFGYTPSLVAGVWAGNNDNKPMQKKGGSILAAVPIWSAFMKEALPAFPIETFPRPQQEIPEKPILRGDYLANHELHTILHYVSRGDATGPYPSNPTTADAQYHNWETAVQNWAMVHLPDYATYNNPYWNASSTSSSTQQGGISIRIDSPSSGSFVQSGQTISLTGVALSPNGLTMLRIYMNGVLLNELPSTYPANYPFGITFTASNVQQQNTLTVQGIAADGTVGNANITLYSSPGVVPQTTTTTTP